jgi:hypothetical protein
MTKTSAGLGRACISCASWQSSIAVEARYLRWRRRQPVRCGFEWIDHPAAESPHNATRRGVGSIRTRAFAGEAIRVLVLFVAQHTLLLRPNAFSAGFRSAPIRQTVQFPGNVDRSSQVAELAPWRQMRDQSTRVCGPRLAGTGFDPSKDAARSDSASLSCWPSLSQSAGAPGRRSFPRP